MILLSAARTCADRVVRDFGHVGLSPPFRDQAEALKN